MGSTRTQLMSLYTQQTLHCQNNLILLRFKHVIQLLFVISSLNTTILSNYLTQMSSAFTFPSSVLGMHSGMNNNWTNLRSYIQSLHNPNSPSMRTLPPSKLKLACDDDDDDADVPGPASTVMNRWMAWKALCKTLSSRTW